MSATNSRIAKLNRAKAILLDYAKHKRDWTAKESGITSDIIQDVNSLITLEKQRRVS